MRSMTGATMRTLFGRGCIEWKTRDQFWEELFLSMALSWAATFRCHEQRDTKAQVPCAFQYSLAFWHGQFFLQIGLSASRCFRLTDRPSFP